MPDQSGLCGAGRDQLIYDATLKVNEGAPILPIRMPLGSSGVGGSGYRFYLVDTRNGNINANRATPLKHRTVI